MGVYTMAVYSGERNNIFILHHGAISTDGDVGFIRPGTKPEKSRVIARVRDVFGAN